MSKGHPKGLYALFFTEMWERLAFYLMLGILVLYSVDTERGGLGLTVGSATEIYGTYLAFVYFTPFLGGMIADRFIGYRKAVLFGGILMAIGFFCLGVRSVAMLYLGLTFLCLGNGLFKPNISAMVGKLYAPGDPRRDAGFNIFYMGINIGAATSAILSAPLRNLFSFNIAFVAAGIGLLIGVAILIANWKKLGVADVRPDPTPEDVTLARIFLVIILPAAVFGAIGYLIGVNWGAISGSIGAVTFAFLVAMIPIVGYFAVLVKKSSPEEKPGMSALMPVYLAGGAFFMILHLSGGLMTFVAENNTDRRAEWIPEAIAPYYGQKAMPSYFGNADESLPRPNNETLIKTDKRIESMFGARTLDQESIEKILAEHPGVKTIEDSASNYEQSWSTLTAKVYENGVVKVEQSKDAHGLSITTVRNEPETAKPLKNVALVKEIDGVTFAVIPVSAQTHATVYKRSSNEELKPGKFIKLINAEIITAFLNPLFVVALTPLVVFAFVFWARRRTPVTTARKIFLGMVITTIALSIMGAGLYNSGDGADKMSMLWFVAFYAIITVGELCLSPMGLSLVTKLAPKRLVGLMMGGWFLATAVGNKMSGFISGLEPTAKMLFILGGLILLVAGFIFILLPKLDAAIKKYGA